MSRQRYDLIAKIGTYHNRNGDKKNKYTQCGSLFVEENGNMYMKLDSVPLSNEWSGFMSVREPFNSSQDDAQEQHPSKSSDGGSPKFEDDVPF